MDVYLLNRGINGLRQVPKGSRPAWVAPGLGVSRLIVIFLTRTATITCIHRLQGIVGDQLISVADPRSLQVFLGHTQDKPGAYCAQVLAAWAPIWPADFPGFGPKADPRVIAMRD